jgi:triacylglycerol lipase
MTMDGGDSICIHHDRRANSAYAGHVATLLVHGIWDSASRLAPLKEGLSARGLTNVTALDLVPNDGRAPIPELAEQVRKAVAAFGAVPIDLVGFSMGALTSRFYLQRLGGRARVRRFVSIAGPQHGTLAAYGLPFAGVRQMRPGSELIRDLQSDPDPWGDVHVHTVTTPYDLMILPSRSGELSGSRSHKSFPVKMHRWMITDARVLDYVAELLRG